MINNIDKIFFIGLIIGCLLIGFVVGLGIQDTYYKSKEPDLAKCQNLYGQDVKVYYSYRDIFCEDKEGNLKKLK